MTFGDDEDIFKQNEINHDIYNILLRQTFITERMLDYIEKLDKKIKKLEMKINKK